MASVASFSPVSGHRHSAQNATAPTAGIPGSLGPFPGSAAAVRCAGSGFNPSLSLSGITIAAAGDSLRRAYLDESALSPSEYQSYVPALLALAPSESEIEGLYDEQSALRYLRERCKLELKDEAVILSLFERTPLGIQPGHFYAWLRLVSWVQQRKRPSKKRLFTQTQPARTFTGAPSHRPIVRRTAEDSTGPPSSLFQPHSRALEKQPSYSPPPLSHPVHREPSKPLKHKSRHKVAHPQLHAQPPAGPVKTRNPVLAVQQEIQPATEPAPDARPASVLGASELEPLPRTFSPRLSPARAQPVHLRPDPAPVLRLPNASSVSSQKPLPLDALIGFNPAPNPLKHGPRLVRPTPVVASASTRNLGGGTMPSWEDPPLQRVANANAASRAPISPLIQAGLDAASQVQRAKMALPPKTYTTIQRSGPTGPIKPKPRRKREQPAGAGEAGDPSVSIVAPQPRRATGATDLSQPQLQVRRAGTLLRSEEGDTTSIRSVRSVRSGRGKYPERPEPMYPGIGDLLGSHLASLGANGRPKSRTALREEGLTVPHWMRDHDSSNPGSSRMGDGLSPRRVMSRSPALTLVEHSSDDATHADHDTSRPSSALGRGAHPPAPSGPAPLTQQAVPVVLSAPTPTTP